MKVAILSDSSVAVKTIKENDIYHVPLKITCGDKSIDDDANLSDDDFYNMLDNQVLKTSQSLLGVLLAKWDELLKTYDHIICVFLSKGLSGQFNTATIASKDEPYSGKVTVIDTNGVSIVNTRIILKVKEMLSLNKTPLEIKDYIEEKSNNLNGLDRFGFIIPKTLDKLVQGGRVSKSVALIAKLSRIFPILKYNGQIDKDTKVRLFKNAIKHCATWFIENNVSVVDISYSRSETETLDLVKNILIENNIKIGLEESLPNTITVHTGRETFALIVSNIF